MISAIPIIAEVLDKEPSIITIWLLFGSIARSVSCLAAIGTGGLPLSFVALMLGLVFFEEFYSVGLLTSGESPSYVAHFYVAVASAALVPVLGAVINFVSSRRAKSRS